MHSNVSKKDILNTPPIPKSSIEFDKIYRVRDMRLRLGYSAFELSFLLGYRPLYVRDVENPLHTLRYSINDTNYLLQIFDCKLDQIMAGKIEEPVWPIIVEDSFNDSMKTYHISHVLPNGSIELYREVIEEPKHIDLKLNSVISAIDAERYIKSLFQENWFIEPRTALQVFHKCIKKYGYPIRPYFVLKALASLTSKRKAPRLITKKNVTRRTIYVSEM